MSNRLQQIECTLSSCIVCCVNSCTYHRTNMKRSSSWKNLEKTFASTPEMVTKRPKCTRSKVTKQNAIKQNISESIDIQIEDSDEENVPDNTATVTATATATAAPTALASLKTLASATQFQRNKRIRRIPKPLLINTSLNSSIISNDTAAAVCNSESDESVCGEPELRDVSELNKSDERRRQRSKVRSKSLLFLDIKTPTNSENPANSRITSADVSLPVQQKKHTKKLGTPTKQRDQQMDDTSMATSAAAAAATVVVDDDDDDDGDVTAGTGTTIDSNSSSNEMDTPKKCTASQNNGGQMKKRQMTRTPSDIVFTQSENSTNPVIESESSQQISLRFIESPTISSSLRRRSRRQSSRKQIKGGLTEQLQKVIGRTKSEYSFWMNERTTNLIEAGSKMHIDKMVYNYGRTLLYCTRSDTATAAEAAEPETNGSQDAKKIVEILCIGPTFKKLRTLQIGKIIEIDFDCRGYMITSDTIFYPHVSKILV